MHYRAHTVSTMSPSVHASTSSHTNMRYLNTPQKFKRYRGLKARCVAAEKKVKRLKESISKLITSSSIEVDNNLNHDLSKIMHDSVALDPVRGNCRKRRRQKEIVIDETPLPKRKRRMDK